MAPAPVPNRAVGWPKAGGPPAADPAGAHDGPAAGTARSLQGARALRWPAEGGDVRRCPPRPRHRPLLPGAWLADHAGLRPDRGRAGDQRQPTRPYPDRYRRYAAKRGGPADRRGW